MSGWAAARSTVQKQLFVNLVQARLALILNDADGNPTGTSVDDAFSFKRETCRVANVYSFDSKTGVYTFTFTENEQAYGEHSKSKMEGNCSFVIDAEAMERASRVKLTLVNQPIERWGINWAASVLYDIGDGRPRIIYLPGERTYDPAGITGDAHASERIGASCCRTQAAITCGELAALNLGATCEQIAQVQQVTRAIIRRYHGRLTLFECMFEQLRCVSQGQDPMSYPDFILKQVTDGELDQTLPSRAHMRTFLLSYKEGNPKPPPEYFSKVRDKDANSLGVGVQAWLKAELSSDGPTASPPPQTPSPILPLAGPGVTPAGDGVAIVAARPTTPAWSAAHQQSTAAEESCSGECGARRRAFHQGAHKPLAAACIKGSSLDVIAELCNAGHLDDLDAETGETALHLVIQRLCPLPRLCEPWAGMQLWLSFATVALYLLERGIDTTVENSLGQTASDIMDVETVHHSAVREGEPVFARAKICHLAGILQVLTEPENPILSSLLVAEDVLKLSRRSYTANNQRYALIAERFTKFSLALLTCETKATTASELTEIELLRDRFGADAQAAYALSDPDYRGETALRVATRSQLINFVASAPVQRVVTSLWLGATLNVNEDGRGDGMMNKGDRDRRGILGLEGNLQLSLAGKSAYQRACRKAEVAFVAPRTYFLLDMTSYLGYLALFCVSISSDNCDGQEAGCTLRTSPVSDVEWVFFVFVLGSGAKLWQRLLVNDLSFARLFQYPWNVLDATIFGGQIIFYWLRLSARARAREDGYDDAEHPDAAVSVVFSLLAFGLALTMWLRLLSFAQAHEDIGPLLITISKMTRDILNFLGLAVALSFGFSFGLFALLTEQEREAVFDGGEGIDLRSVGKTLLLMVTQLLGYLDADVRVFAVLSPTKYALVAVLYTLYSIFAGVMLLNLLIAMMSYSYDAVTQQSILIHQFYFTRLYQFYDRHRFAWPVPLNLLQLFLSYFVVSPLVCLRGRDADDNMFNSIMDARQIGGVKRKAPSAGDPVAHQTCRYCLARQPSPEPVLFCKRCARHGKGLRHKNRLFARVTHAVFHVAATAGFFVAILASDTACAMLDLVERAWAALIPVITHLASSGGSDLDDDDETAPKPFSQKVLDRRSQHSKRRSQGQLLVDEVGSSDAVEPSETGRHKRLGRDAEFNLNQRENLQLLKRMVFELMRAPAADVRAMDASATVCTIMECDGAFEVAATSATAAPPVVM